jgi:4-carboxymuconolactone decarboxylase
VNNGLTDEEIAEVIQHAAVYAGVPAANHAFKGRRTDPAGLRGPEVNRPSSALPARNPPAPS